MSDTSVIQIAVMAMMTIAKLSMPVLGVSLVIGLTISLLQAMTQVQEITLTFVPKLAGVAVVLLVAGNWMLAEIVNFTIGLYDLLPTLLGKV